jgi:hypothetical protein
MAEEVEYEGLQNASVGVNMLAGALAGISEHVVMYPVDSIKASSRNLLTLSRKKKKKKPRYELSKKRKLNHTT